MKKVILLVPAAAVALLWACGEDAAEPETGTPTLTTTAAAEDLTPAGEVTVTTTETAAAGTPTQELKPSPGTATPPADAAGIGGGTCEVTLSGDVAATVVAPGGPSAVGTDYWYTEDELREAVTQLVRFGNPDVSEAEIERQVDEAMQKETRIYVLILNCVTIGTPEVSISLLPSNSSQYADVPFGPGSYPLKAGGLFGGAENPGEFTALMTIDEQPYGLTEDGELSISRFDRSGISGTFTFTAEEAFAEGAAKKVSVAGKFEFDCTGPSVCE